MRLARRAEPGQTAWQGRLAQLVRAPRLHRGGRGFEPLAAHQTSKKPPDRSGGFYCVRDAGLEAEAGPQQQHVSDIVLDLLGIGADAEHAQLVSDIQTEADDRSATLDGVWAKAEVRAP